MIMSLIELLQSNEKMNNFNNKSIKGKIIVTEEITPKDVIDIYHNKGMGLYRLMVANLHTVQF